MLRVASFACGLAVPTFLMLVVETRQDVSLETAYSALNHVERRPDIRDGKGAYRANDGLFYIDGFTQNRSVRFLVDTGASHVVLSHRDANHLTVTPLESKNGEFLQTAAGPARVQWVNITEIRIDGHVLKNLRAAVPHRDIGMSLLGQNALAQFGAIHIDGDQIAFKY